MRNSRSALAGMILLLLVGMIGIGYFLLNGNDRPTPVAVNHSPQDNARQASELRSKLPQDQPPRPDSPPPAEDPPGSVAPPPAPPASRPDGDDSDTPAGEEPADEKHNRDDDAAFTFMISGQVIDEHGIGVAGAVVNLSLTLFPNSRQARQGGGGAAVGGGSFIQGGSITAERHERFAVTDAAGYFSGEVRSGVANIRHASVSLKASAEGYLESSPHQLRNLQSGGSETNITLQLPSPGGITGAVVFEGGVPAAGIVVQIARLGAGRGAIETATTNEAGIYDFKAVAPGAYTLSIASESVTTLSGPNQVDVRAHARTRVSADFIVTGRTGLRITLLDESGHTFRGSSERHLPFVSIFIDRANGETTRTGARVGEGGVIEIYNIPEDAIGVTLSTFGFEAVELFNLNFLPGRLHDAGSVVMKKAKKAEKQPGGESAAPSIGPR